MAFRARNVSGACEKRAPGPDLIPPKKVRNGVDIMKNLCMVGYILFNYLT